MQHPARRRVKSRGQKPVRGVVTDMNPTRVRPFAIVLATAFLITAANGELLQRRVFRPGVGPGGGINLPYMVADASGNQWRIYQGGWMQQAGNMPLYSQGAMLMVNG